MSGYGVTGHTSSYYSVVVGHISSTVIMLSRSFEIVERVWAIGLGDSLVNERMSLKERLRG